MPLSNLIRTIKKSFALKVYATFFIALTVFFTIMNSVYQQIQQEALRTALLKDGELMAEIFAEDARLAIFAEDSNQLSVMSQGILKVPGMLAVCTFNSDMKKLSCEKKQDEAALTLMSSLTAGKNGGFLEKVKHSARPLVLETKNCFEFWAPVRTQSTAFSPESLYFEEEGSAGRQSQVTIGFVGITIDKQQLVTGFRAILKKNIAILLLFLLLSGVTTWFIVRAVTRPLRSLINSVKSHDIATQAESEDELGLLASTYDSLVTRLGESFATINSLNQDLEEQVWQLQREIDARLRAEIEVRQHEKQYRTLVETIKDIVYTLDRQGRITYISPIVEQLSGYRPSELIGLRFTEFLIPARREELLLEFEKRLQSEETISLTAEFLTKHGTEISLEINGSPLFDGHGYQIGRIGSARDITHRIQAEKRRHELEVKALAQSKLASLGEIAAGVAHEINQPLSYIKVIYESALRDFEQGTIDPKELRTDFQEALRQVNRITHIVNHLRTFGRVEPARFGPVGLKEVLDNTMILMQEKIKLRNIALIEKIEEPLPPIYGSAINLEQVFINLLQNSIDALEGMKNGEITVTMTDAGDSVLLGFIDNGRGIPSDLHDKIFEPFFTTREVGKGTGLGLAIVYGIVKDHQGTMELESRPGKGTKFFISLPKYKPENEE